MGDPVTQVFNGQEVEVWPQIVWKPKWGLTFSEIKKKISGSCSISQRSAMVINGRDIFVEDLSLDGALLVNSVDEAEVNESHHSPAEPHIFGNSVLSFFLSFFLSFLLYQLLVDHETGVLCIRSRLEARCRTKAGSLRTLIIRILQCLSKSGSEVSESTRLSSSKGRMMCRESLACN